MSDFSVVDGRGRGIRAAVDREHRLHAHAVVDEMAAKVSQVDGLLFMSATSLLQDSHTITAAGGHLAILQNVHPSLNWVGTSVTYYPTASDMFTYLYLDITIGTLGNATEVTPVNLNVGSPNLPDSYIRSWVWDEVGDGMTGVTGGQPAGLTRMYGGPVNIQLESALVLPPGRAMSLFVKGVGEMTSSIFGYMLAPTD